MSELTVAQSAARLPAAASQVISASQVIVVVSSPARGDIGREIAIPPGGLVIGRDQGVGLEVDDSGVSRRHARLERIATSGDLRLVDLDSRNGTYVNGFRVRAATLCQGDRIQLGISTTLRVGSTGGEALVGALVAGRTGAWSWNVATGGLSWSDHTAAILEVVPRALPATLDQLLDAVDDGGALRRTLQSAASAGGAFEAEFRLSLGGRSWWVAMRGEALLDATGKPGHLRGTLVDESSRMEVERALRRQAQVFDNLEDGVVVIDLEGRVLDCNRAVEKAFGCAKHELVSREFDRELWGRAACEVHAGLARDGEWKGEVRCRARCGREFQAEVVIVPMRDENGRTVAWFAIHRDVEERRQAEAKLRVTERLASVGTLAAGVAHEINNPLAFVRTNLNLIASDLQVTSTLDEELLAMLRDACRGVDRIATIVRDLRTFCRDERSARRERVDLRRSVEFAVRMSEGHIKPKAALELDFEEVPEVLGSEVRFGQVFLNLLVNAADSLTPSRSGTHRIRVSTRREGEWAIVSISDTGCGMSREVLERIFDPFFSTKSVGSGTGLGLSISHSIIKDAGGEIGVESEVGVGTTFTVKLPAASSPDPS